MSDDSDDFVPNGEDETGPLSDSGNQSNPADPTVPDPHARSRRFDFRGRIGVFLINREIGRGGMGVVYEATDTMLNRRVALKILPPGALIDETQIRRFRNEATAAAQLIHPNIVPVFSVDSDRGIHYYAMQLIDGQNIAQVIGSIRERLSTEDKLKHNADTPKATIGTTQRADAPTNPAAKGSKDTSSRKQLMEDDFADAVSSHRHPQSCQRLFKSIAAIGCDAARAINHAHEAGIIHRDIKPHNLLLDEKGKVWVTDFGLALIRDNPVGTGTGDIIGTLKYMSPEQASGRRFLVDHRTDIYSLGVTLYELLTLKPALSGTGPKELIRQVSFEDPLSLRAINSRIPAELETIILKSIAKNPQERYNTAAEFADDLERFCNDQPIAAKPPSIAQKVRRWMVKNQAATGMIGVGMVFTFLASLGITAATLSSNNTIILERQKAVELLSQSEGWRLLTNARAVLPRNPGLAIAFARESSKRVGGLETNMLVQDAISANHELQLLQPRPEPTHRLTIASRSQKCISTVDGKLFGKGNYPPIVIGLRGNEPTIKLGTEDAITSAAFSPSEQIVLTASCGLRSYKESASPEEKSVNPAALWELSTGRRLRNFVDHPIREACEEMFSPDGTTLVLPGPGNEATVYGLDSNSRKFALREHKTPVLHAVYSPNGALIATSDTSGETILFDANGNLKKRIALPDGRVGNRLRFSFDSNLILISTDKGTWSYSILEGQNKATFWQEPAFEISPSQNRCAAYAPKGQRVNIRDMASGASVCEITGLDPITSSEQSIQVAFNSNSQRVVVACGTTISVHDAASGQVLYKLLGHSAPVTSVKYNRSNETIVSSSMDGSIRVWSELSGADRQKIESTTDGRGSSQVQFSSDSRNLLTGSTIESRTLLFDADGKRMHGSISGQLASKVHIGQQIAVKNGSSVSLIEPATSRVIKTRVFSDRVDECVPVNNGQAFIVTFDMRPPFYWNITTDLLTQLLDKGDSLTSHAVSEDSSKFILGTANGRIQVHEATTGVKNRTIYQPSTISFVGFMPDSTRFFSIDEQSRLRIWADSDEVAQLTMAEKGINFTRALISSDSKFAVTYHEGNPDPVCCWDVAKGALVRKIAGSKSLKATLHPSKSTVYLGSRQEGLRAWDFETDEVRVLTSNAVVELASLPDRLFTVESPSGTSFKPGDVVQEPRPALGTVKGYSIETEKVVAEITSTEGALRSSISVNRAMNQVAASASVFSVTIAERNSPQTAVLQGSHTAPISFTSFIGKSTRVATASWDGKLKIWGENNQLVHTLGDLGGPITCGAISADGKTIACGHEDGSIGIWNAETGEASVTLKASDAAIVSLAFDGTGLNLVAVERSPSVRYWDLISRKHKEILADDSEPSALLSPDGKSLVLFPHNGQNAGVSAKIVTLTSGKEEALPQSLSPRSGSFSDNGKKLALVLNNGSVVVYELSNDANKVNRVVKSSSETYINASFSPTDNLIALLAEKSVAIWDLETGEQVHSIPSPEGSRIHSGSPSSFAHWSPFSDDGNWLGLATAKGAYVFPVNPPKAIDAFTSRSLLASEREQYHVGLDDLVRVQPD